MRFRTNIPKIKPYFEDLSCHSMAFYPFFSNKLHLIEKYSRKIGMEKLLLESDNDFTLIFRLPSEQKYSRILRIRKMCEKCVIKRCYQIGNIIWPDNIEHRINEHKLYPSEYFINTILNIRIINGYILNPPIVLDPSIIKYFRYIPLHHNKLLILDALMKQGSQPRYEYNGQYVYSEHYGVLTVKDFTIDNIIVSTDGRIDSGDDKIILPSNNNLMKEHEYIFHTHPNSSIIGGRIEEGVIYEFPSANDIINFVKYHYNGRVQASIIISPEGMYVIRPIIFGFRPDISNEFFRSLEQFILKLEKLAIKKFNSFRPFMNDPNFFHPRIGQDFRYIELYNKYINSANLFVEYYPRKKKNGEWCLESANLPYVDNFSLISELYKK
ncbi:MAG: hypothetical protein QXW79_00920 [Thermoplasmata archaeon]